MKPASLAIVARRMSFIRETDGPNEGAWVAFVLRHTGNKEGDSWCCSFVSLIEDIAYRGKAPTKRTASCQQKLDDCRIKGLIVETPQVDDLCFTVDATGHAHHIGIVTGTAPFTTIAGNTSEDGTSSNGTGTFEHPVNRAGKVFARLPK